jgi:hypothetical protein
MSEELTITDWRTRLERKGHRILDTSLEWPADSILNVDPASLPRRIGWELLPGPETIVTVANEDDGDPSTFECKPDARLCFRLFECPEGYRSHWLELVDQQPPGGYWQDFLAGPGAWLLCRLARFNKIVVWADTDLWDGGYQEWGIHVLNPTRPFSTTSNSSQPYVVGTDEERFVDVVAAWLSNASNGAKECYMANLEATEAYLAHHHDKIVASIPDAETRRALLK